METKSIFIFQLGVTALIGCLLLEIVQCEVTNSTDVPVKNETLYFFLLAIPESSIPRLENLNRFRQEDEDAPVRTFAQTGQHLGQIIRGVLGGDFRPIFAGSLQFVEEPMAQQNLNSFLGTIAPALNLGLREIVNRATNYLGITSPSSTPVTSNATVTETANRANTTTPKPLANHTTYVKQPTLQEIIKGKLNSSSISPTDSVLVLEQGENENRTVTVYIGQELVYEEKQPDLFYQQKYEEEKMKASTSSWQYVLNQIHGETTTPPPLPLIQLRTTTPEDLDYDDMNQKKVI